MAVLAVPPATGLNSIKVFFPPSLGLTAQYTRLTNWDWLSITNRMDMKTETDGDAAAAAAAVEERKQMS